MVAVEITTQESRSTHRQSRLTHRESKDRETAILLLLVIMERVTPVALFP